ADKECIATNKFTAYEAVSELATQVFKSLQASAKVLRDVPSAIGHVAHLPVNVRRYSRIILYHNNSGSKTAKGFPYVISVPVDVERQQVKLFWHTELLEQLGNVLASCKRDEVFEAILLKVLPVFQSSDKSTTSI